MNSPNPSRPSLQAAKVLLSVRRLRVAFAASRFSRAGDVQAVEDLHFDLAAGESLGILGEPGSGKTTLARALAGLQAIDGGGIVFEGRDIARSPEGWKASRGGIQMLFADARDSLDPRLTIEQSIAETLSSLCPDWTAEHRAARISQVLDSLGAGTVANQFPAQLDDHACRIACLARALAPAPSILICDEIEQSLGLPSDPRLLERIHVEQQERGMAVVMTGGDARAVTSHCERVIVMSVGRALEQGRSAEIAQRPRHPYSKALFARTLEGERPDPAHPPSGCVFRTRCAMADELCARELPYLRRVSESGHAACHYVHGAAEEESVGVARIRV